MKRLAILLAMLCPSLAAAQTPADQANDIQAICKTATKPPFYTVASDIQRLALIFTLLCQSTWAVEAQRGGFVTSIPAPPSGQCATDPNLTCDASGWAVFTPPVCVSACTAGQPNYCEGVCTPPGEGGGEPGTRAIFVSWSRGNDSTGTGTFANPYKTTAVAAPFLRGGRPDWLLYAKGDTWPSPNLPGLNVNRGLNASNPEVFSSYNPSAAHTLNVPPVVNPYDGGARPHFLADAAANPGTAFGIQGGGIFGNHVAVSGLKLDAYTRNPYDLVNYTVAASQAFEQGFSALGDTVLNAQNLFIEDCWVGYFIESLDISAYNNVWVSRNQFLYSYANANNQTNGVKTSAIFGGPGGFVFDGNVMDHGGWNTDNGITWSPPQGTVHNVYTNYDSSVITWTNNIVANGPSGDQFRGGGIMNGNLWLHENESITWASAYSYGGNTIQNNVFLDSVKNIVGDPLGIEFQARYSDTYPTTSGSITSKNIFSGSMQAPSNVQGISLDAGVNANTVGPGNIIFNWSSGNSGNAIISTAGSPFTFTITNGGSGYPERKIAFTSIASSSGALAYDSFANAVLVFGSSITATLGSNGSNASFYMPAVGGIPAGVYRGTIVDPTHLELFVPFNSTAAGNLYYAYYAVPLSYSGTVHGGTGVQVDLFSISGVIVAYNLYGSDLFGSGLSGEVQNNPGQDYLNGETLTAAAGTACSNCPVGGFGNGSGSGLVLTISSIASNTVSANGCNLAVNNQTDVNGTNGSCSFTDPYRTVGSYYKTLAGSATNTTGTGSIASGVLSLTSYTGALNIGDAISYVGQTKADYVKSFGGSNGSPVTGGGGSGAVFLLGWTAGAVTSVIVPLYGFTGSGYSVSNVLTISGGTASTTAQLTVSSVDGNGAVTGVTISRAGSYSTLPPVWLASKDGPTPASASSGSVSSWTYSQFLALADNNGKDTLGAAPGWNTALTARCVNQYINAGFGVTSACP